MNNKMRDQLAELASLDFIRSLPSEPYTAM